MAKQLPKVYIGMHFQEGVAAYDNDSGSQDILLVSNDVIKKMNPTFSGCPVYVGHKPVNLDNIQNEADGYVVESFFNKADGKSWVKFVAVSDAAHEAILKGWRLSNSYTVKNALPGGRWHNVEYHSEVTDGEFSHLAIVENPRYEESVILTPEQFRDYNLKKESELMTLQNSKDKQEKKKMKLIEKLKDFIKQNEVEVEVKPDEKKVENPSNEKIKVGDEEMSLNELIEKYSAAKNRCNEFDKKEEEAKKNAEEEEKKKAEELAKKNAEEEKKNGEGEKEEENEVDEKKKKEIEAAEARLNEIKNAINNENIVKVVETQANKVARGKKLYGSK